MFLRRSRKLDVDLGELRDECQTLSSFLISKLKADVTSSNNKIFIKTDYSSPSELKRLVNKFIYRRHLNYHYWVELDGNTVKVNKYKRFKKKEEDEKKTRASNN